MSDVYVRLLANTFTRVTTQVAGNQINIDWSAGEPVGVEVLNAISVKVDGLDVLATLESKNADLRTLVAQVDASTVRVAEVQAALEQTAADALSIDGENNELATRVTELETALRTLLWACGDWPKAPSPDAISAGTTVLEKK